MLNYYGTIVGSVFCKCHFAPYTASLLYIKINILKKLEIVRQFRVEKLTLCPTWAFIKFKEKQWCEGNEGHGKLQDIDIEKDDGTIKIYIIYKLSTIVSDNDNEEQFSLLYNNKVIIF